MSGNITFLPLDAPRLGDYARDIYGHTGRIYQIDRSCEESEDWIAAQGVPITEDERHESWLHMLVHPAGGAVAGPASRFTKIDPVENFHEQRDAAEYFSDCVREDTKYVNMNERRHHFSL